LHPGRRTIGTSQGSESSSEIGVWDEEKAAIPGTAEDGQEKTRQGLIRHGKKQTCRTTPNTTERKKTQGPEERDGCENKETKRGVRPKESSTSAKHPALLKGRAN